MSIDPGLWLKALREFNEEKFFECHETLEVIWLNEVNPEQKNLLQGIIHIAAAFFHYRRNNLIGYRKQIEKGSGKLKSVRVDVYAEILRTDLSEFYHNILSVEKLSSFPKIHFTASEASR